MGIGEQIETIVQSMTGNNNPPQVVTIRKGYDNNTADIITKDGVLKNVRCSGKAEAGDNALLTYDNGDMQTPFVLLFTGDGGGGGGDVDIDTSFPSSPSDTHVPSTKLVKDNLDAKISKSSTSGLVKNDGTIDTKTYQELLSSGVNIKTINNNSLLGSGNITIQGGGGSVIGTGSFSIDNNGHLIVELPDAVDNPYYINSNGHLIYDTSNTHNGE